MSLFAISDLHLSTDLETDKSMEVFGRRWTDYTARLASSWRAVVSDADTVVLPGDISWANTLDEALSDFRFLHALPGKKIIGKGNHDFWWATAAKMNAWLLQNHFDDIRFLYNNAYLTDEAVIAGTRGWFQEESAEHGDCEKLIKREAQRLSLSLSAAKQISEGSGKPILAFLHFPPVWNEQICRPILEVLHAFDVRQCFFGHIHGVYTVPAHFEFEEIGMTILSADYLEFLPKKLL